MSLGFSANVLRYRQKIALSNVQSRQATHRHELLPESRLVGSDLASQ